MRVAAVDCGTNTLRLLIADIDRRTGRQTELVRRTEIVRLGQDVDRTGRFAAAALQRTFAMLDEYAAAVDDHAVGSDARRVVATSAARDVANRDLFVNGVGERLGVLPEVIPGSEEAALTYDGATRRLLRRPDFREPVLVLDIGGGSTEIAMADPHTGQVSGVSVDVGSVRLTERYLDGDPPSWSEVGAAANEIDRALDSVGFGPRDVGCLVGVAGTVATVGAMVLGLETLDRDRLDLARLPRADVDAATDRLLAMTVAERRALPYIPEGRADVIGGGALILSRVLARVDVPDVVVSEQDLLDGVAWSIAGRR